MKMAYTAYYSRLITGSAFILGIFFLWFLFQASDLAGAGAAVLLTITRGILLGASMPGILLCVVVSSGLMGYGLFVRKRSSLRLFWAGFALFFLAGLMGMGTRY